MVDNSLYESIRSYRGMSEILAVSFMKRVKYHLEDGKRWRSAKIIDDKIRELQNG